MNRYPWPASAVTPQDMALLHQARESSPPRVPITQLIAMAIRTQYGQVPLSLPVVPVTHQDERKVT